MAALAIIVATSSVAGVPSTPLTLGPVHASTIAPGVAEAPTAQIPSAVFDNFNRTVSNQFQTWGTASSGSVWSAFACTGYTASVNGQAGVMTGSAGASCLLAAGANQVTNPSNPSLRYWDAPSWALTGRFKLSALDGSRFRVRITGQNVANPVADFAIYTTPSANEVVLNAWPTGQDVKPFAWQVDTWYVFKWAVIWDNQQRLKIWPEAETEPAEWLAATAGPAAQSWQEPRPFMLDWRSEWGSTSVFVDDLAFGPAPFLPALPPPPGTNHNQPSVNQAESGDPVNTFTGALGDSYVDVAIPGRGPAPLLTRSYNSNDSRVTTLGPGWTHSYNTRLVSPGDATGDVILVGPQGRSDRYVESGGVFTPPLGVYRTLVKNADGSYTAEEKDQTQWVFDASGLLAQIVDRYGNASSLTYNAAGQLASITDPAGRGSLSFAYQNGRLTSVSDSMSPARVVSYQYDTDGRLWKVTDREGQTTTYAYDGTTHRLATITDARGKVILTTTYDAQGRVATQKDARGLITGDVATFNYVVNPDGTRVTTTTAPATSHEPSFQPTIEDTYSSDGWLAQRVTHPSSTETLTQSFTYDAAGNRTSVTDTRGNRTDFCFDVDYAGAAVTNSAGNLTRVIGPAPTVGANRPVGLAKHDAQDNVIQTVAPEGVPSGTTVTCATDLSAITTAHATDFTYDVQGVFLLASTVRFTDPEAGLRTAVTKYEYADAANPGLVTRIIPPRGNTTGSPDYTYATTFTYYTTGSQAGMLKDVADALGNKSSFTYDAVGRRLTVVDPLGNAAGGVAAEHTSEHVYDKEDRLRYLKLPSPIAGGSQLVSETRYDEVGHATVRIDANGQVTTYAYDDRGSLFEVNESPQPWTDPASPPAQVFTTEYTRDAGGNPVRITRAKGDTNNERVTDYAYDGRGLPRTETQYPNWPATTGALVTTFAYDGAGNPTVVVDPLGKTISAGFDALNRRVSLGYSDAATPDVTYEYDANGNRTEMVDGTGTATYVVDELGRPVSVTSPGPKSVGYRYDLDGNRAKVVYPDATAVTYSFDKADRLVGLTDWAARSVAYTYWPDGLVKTVTNPDGSVSSYAYDNVRRLIDIVDASAGGVPFDRSFYTLDAVGNVTTVNHGLLPAQFSRPDGTTSTSGSWTGTHASINEVVPNDATFLRSPQGPVDPAHYEVSLSDVAAPMDLSGIKLRVRVAKSGNDGGQTTAITVTLRQGSTTIYSTGHSNLPGASGSGWVTVSANVPAQAVSLITDYSDLRIRFSPTSAGGGQKRYAQVSWAELEVPPPPDSTAGATYTYDGLYRLTEATDTAGTRTYSYDPVGNRLTRVDGSTTTYTYDRADRLTAAGATSITIDANGNLTARGSETFAYDQANRLTSATVNGTTEAYVYDGDGTRFSRQVGASPAIRYVADRSGPVALTLDDGTREYVYGLGLAYAVAGSSLEVYHVDQLRSVRTITDGTGAVTATYRTDEWGMPTGGTGSSSQPLGFTGEPRDGTGLTYLRTRYYDPDLGRYLSRDTWPGSPAVPQSQNRYTYVANNPTSETDPSGRFVDTFADAAFIVYDVASLVFGPEKERGANLLALGADVGSLFLPFVTGGGWLARGGIEAAEHVDDAIGGVRWLEDAAKSACSFTAETLVATPDGPVPISSIEVGDIVLAWDEATGTIVERTVTAVLPHPDDEIARVTLDGVVLTTTPDHPFYTIEQGWVEAGLLWPGARVLSTQGTAVVSDVEIAPYAGTLWDLTVAGAHTFFVGEGEWLVHNCPYDPARAAGDAAGAVNRGAVNVLSDSGARRLVGDPHAFKAEFVGSAGSRFNIGVDKATGQIVLVSHDGLQVLPTGQFKP